MVTVPACSRCHRPTSKDDEYFRTVIALRQDLHDHPDIRSGVLDAAMRSLTRPENITFARAFVQGIRDTEIRTPAGLYLGKGGGYVVDHTRVFRVIERVVRGLFYRHHQSQLGADYGVKAFEDSFVDWSAVEAEVLKTVQNTARALANQPQIEIGTVFRYSYWTADEDVRVSAWLMKFYNRIVFLAITGPKIDPR